MYSITKYTIAKNAVRAVYEFLSDLCGEYNNFRQWYYGTVVPSLTSGKRLIYVVIDNEAIVAVLILKNADEKKICTLRVAENYRHQGIASMLLNLAFRELQCTKPLITVSSYHIDEFKPLLEKKRVYSLCEISKLLQAGSHRICLQWLFVRKPRHLSLVAKCDIMNSKKEMML